MAQLAASQQDIFLQRPGRRCWSRHRRQDWAGRSSEVTVLGDPNRNNTRLLDQWFAIGKARSVT